MAGLSCWKEALRCLQNTGFHSDTMYKEILLFIGCKASRNMKLCGYFTVSMRPGASTQWHVCVPLSIQKLSELSNGIWHAYMEQHRVVNIPLESSWTQLLSRTRGICIPPMYFLPASLDYQHLLSRCKRQALTLGRDNICPFAITPMPISIGCTYHKAHPLSAGPEVLSISMGTSGPSRIRTLMISLPIWRGGRMSK